MRTWTICIFMGLCLWFSYSQTVQATPLTISVDLQYINKKDFARFQILQLHRKLLVRLTEAGFAVVGAQLSSPLRITLRAQKEHLTALIKAASFSQTRRIPRAKETLAQYHLEVIHKLVASARQIRWKFIQHRDKQAKRTKPKAIPRRRPPPLKRAKLPKPRPKVAPQRPNPWGWALDVAVLGLYRIEGLDLLLRGGVRWGQERGFGIQASVLFSPSASPPLTVLEWGFQIGPSWRQPLRPKLAIEIGLLFGFSHHTFVIGSESSELGKHWDFIGNLVLTLHWQPLRFFGFRPWLAAGAASQGRLHQNENVTLWERSLLRFEFGITLFFPLS